MSDADVSIHKLKKLRLLPPTFCYCSTKTQFSLNCLCITGASHPVSLTLLPNSSIFQTSPNLSDINNRAISHMTLNVPSIHYTGHTMFSLYIHGIHAEVLSPTLRPTNHRPCLHVCKECCTYMYIVLVLVCVSLCIYVCS